jgi:hypothetical protein
MGIIGSLRVSNFSLVWVTDSPFFRVRFLQGPEDAFSSGNLLLVDYHGTQADGAKVLCGNPDLGRGFNGLNGETCTVARLVTGVLGERAFVGAKENEPRINAKYANHIYILPCIRDLRFLNYSITILRNYQIFPIRVYAWNSRLLFLSAFIGGNLCRSRAVYAIPPTSNFEFSPPQHA